MKGLRRFWFRFAGLSRPSALTLGCGVTAHDQEDALKVLRERVFAQGSFPAILECLEDVDVSTLDERHVLPNLGDVTARGIWFPQGY